MRKTVLSTVLITAALIYAFFYFFNYKIIKTSQDSVPYSPVELTSEIEIDSSIQKPGNIIFFIADGFGFSHLSLAMMSFEEEGKPSVWDKFTTRAWHDTRCTFGPLTDSGASATAMGTGTSTFWDMIGQDENDKPLENLFELASINGYNTGIVTDSYIWDATPAAFYAHTRSRDSSRIILNQAAQSELDVLFGELEDVGEDNNPDYDETMKILTKRFRLIDESLELPTLNGGFIPVATAFKEDQVQDLSSTPSLYDLTELAINYLNSQQDPFTILIECEEMDSGGHESNSKRTLAGLEALLKTLEFVIEFAEENENTLVIFTSDHETGGLAISTANNYPNMQLFWATINHTAEVVPLFAYGPGADIFTEVKRNRDIGVLLKSLIRASN